MVVGVLIGHFSIGIHAVRLKILLDASCISCLKEDQIKSSQHFLLKCSDFCETTLVIGNRNKTLKPICKRFRTFLAIDSLNPIIGVFCMTSQRTVHNSLNVISALLRYQVSNLT